MTTAGQREDRFSDITKVRALGTRFYAMSGERNTVIVASNVANVATVVGETAALGSDARDIASNGSTQLYILTDLGLQVATLADTPILGTRHAFNPGAGRWVIYSGGYVFAPAPGGLRVIDPALGEVSLSTVGGVADIALARLTSDGLIYGVDQKRAKIHVWRVIGSRAKYISSYVAYNCRDIVQVLIDETAHILFVQCKHRIVGFNIPSSGAVDDAVTVTLRQDYGKLAEDYTDFVKIGTNKYWTGVNADSPLNAGSAFLGRTYADWDVTNQAMVAAFPDMAVFATSDVTPYVGELAIPPAPGLPEIPAIVPPVIPVIPVTPPYVPPVITVPKPVITSSLTATVTEDTVFSYTITATGTGPIYYDTVGAPGWVTSINHTTGVVLGMPPDPGTVNLTITATNSGGTDTKTLVVTVTPAIGNMSAVSVLGTVTAMTRVNNLLYIVGGFSQVQDASGLLSRTNAACIDMVTGLWTSWNPSPTGGALFCIGYDGTWIYLGGAITTVNSVARQSAARVHPTTGANDSWAPTFTAASYVLDFMYDGTDMWLCGGFTTVNGSAHEYVAKFTPSSGALSSWRAYVPQMPTYADRYLIPVSSNTVRTLIDRGGSILILGGAGSAMDTAGGGQYRAKGFILVDKSTGVIAQSVHSVVAELNPQNHGAAVIGGLVYTTSSFGISSYQNIPSGTDAATGLPVGTQVILSGTSVVTGFSPAFYTLETDWLRAYAGVGANILIAGSFSRLGGDTSKRRMQLVTPSGSLATGFTGDWAVSVPSGVSALLDLGGGNIAVGISGASTVTTYNGALTQGLMFIIGATGARY